ncbi:TPA: hypothetical protein ACH7DU_005698, partial [Escherichia coli]
AHVASLRCISLIIKGLHLVRSVNSRRKHIQTASLRHVMGFPIADYYGSSASQRVIGAMPP